MQVFHNDFNVYGHKEKHLNYLRKCMTTEKQWHQSQSRKMFILHQLYNINGIHRL
jgi:hypothetical protein